MPVGTLDWENVEDGDTLADADEDEATLDAAEDTALEAAEAIPEASWARPDTVRLARVARNEKCEAIMMIILVKPIAFVYVQYFGMSLQLIGYFRCTPRSDTAVTTCPASVESYSLACVLGQP